MILQIKRELPRKVLKEATDDQTLPLCWKGKRPFKRVSDVRKYFKPLALDFTTGGKTKTYALPPEAYLIVSVSLTNDVASSKFHVYSIKITLVLYNTNKCDSFSLRGMFAWEF